MTFIKFTLVATALLFPFELWAGEEGMSSMPKISPKKTYTISSKESARILLTNAGLEIKNPWFA